MIFSHNPCQQQQQKKKMVQEGHKKANRLAIKEKNISVFLSWYGATSLIRPSLEMGILAVPLPLHLRDHQEKGGN